MAEQPFWPDGKRGALSLTFDDARVSQADVGLDLLARHAARATFYVSPGAVELRLDAWRRAVAAGHEIGNHTYTHPCSGNFVFSRANAAESHTLQSIEADIDEATLFIQDHLGVTPATFAFPCNQDFVGRGPTHTSYAPLAARKFLACRRGFSETHNHPDFVHLPNLLAMDLDGASVDRARALIDNTMADNGWLILHGHEVGPGKVQSVHPDVLDAVCRYATDPANGIWLDTVASVAGHVKERRGY